MLLVINSLHNMLDFYVPQAIASLVIIALWVLSRLINGKLIRKYGKIKQKSDARMMQVKRVINVLFNIIFIVILAVIWGIQPRNLMLGLSSVFAVIGIALFAQWSILSNITAGLIMFFSAPYRVGDRIHIIDKDMPIIAVIENIQTFYTHIRTDDDELIVLPNNVFLQKTVSIKR